MSTNYKIGEIITFIKLGQKHSGKIQNILGTSYSVSAFCGRTFTLRQDEILPRSYSVIGSEISTQDSRQEGEAADNSNKYKIPKKYPLSPHSTLIKEATESSFGDCPLCKKSPFLPS